MGFKNAFPTMSHEMVAAALDLMCIPFLYIRLILHRTCTEQAKDTSPRSTITRARVRAKGFRCPQCYSPW